MGKQWIQASVQSSESFYQQSHLPFCIPHHLLMPKDQCAGKLHQDPLVWKMWLAALKGSQATQPMTYKHRDNQGEYQWLLKPRISLYSILRGCAGLQKYELENFSVARQPTNKAMWRCEVIASEDIISFPLLLYCHVSKGGTDIASSPHHNGASLDFGWHFVLISHYNRPPLTFHFVSATGFL